MSVVEHELGHIAGLKDIETVSNDVMDSVLGVGVRRTASHKDAIDSLFAA